MGYILITVVIFWGIRNDSRPPDGRGADLERSDDNDSRNYSVEENLKNLIIVSNGRRALVNGIEFLPENHTDDLCFEYEAATS